MVDRPPRLIDVIRKLDLLDGRIDGAYAATFLPITLPLRTPATSAGACYQAAMRPECAGKGDACGATARFETLRGRSITVDCRKLAGMLDVLGEMSLRMPRVRAFFAAVERGRAPVQTMSALRLTYDDFFGFHVVNEMILSLLVGIHTTDDALFHVFANVPFEEYDNLIQLYGKVLRRPEFEDRATTTVGGALVLFSALGRKYGFSIKPFTFKKILKGFKPE